MPHLKAVLFDLGGTLVRTDPISEIFLRILRRHKVHVSLEWREEIFPEVVELDLESFKLPYIEFWRAYNLRILEKLGVQGDLGQLADRLTEEWWDNAELEVYPEVEDTLRRLRQMGLKIGIVSNGFQIDIHEILSRTGLEGMFDLTVGVDDVKKPKPHPEIFIYALKKLEIKPHEALFVGDNPETDYKGAEAAGLKPLLIDRENKIQGLYRKIRNLREVINHV